VVRGQECCHPDRAGATPHALRPFGRTPRRLETVLRLRDSHGRPTGQVRLIALLAAIGLIAISAPAVLALLRWITDLVW
jgi:hypothetical protein